MQCFQFRLQAGFSKNFTLIRSEHFKIYFMLMNIPMLKNTLCVDFFSLKLCRISYHNLKNQQHGNKKSKESSS